MAAPLDGAETGEGPRPRDDKRADARADAVATAVLETVHDAFRPKSALARRMLGAAFAPAARAAARRGLRFDRAAATGAVDRAAADALRPLVRDVSVVGPHRPPASGPVLLACNHAGLGDALAAIAAAGRADMSVVARRRGLLTALPGFGARLIEVEDDRPSAALRRMLTRLERGGAVLMFPAGDIEPDPALDLAGARRSLARWSRSLDVIAARAPEAAIVPTAVGGVVSRRALSAPPARWIADARDSAFAAGTLQLLAPGFQDARVRIAFGAPIVAAGRDAADQVRAAMTGLLGAVVDAGSDRKAGAAAAGARRVRVLDREA